MNASNFEKKLQALQDQFTDLETQLVDPGVVANRSRLSELSQKHAELLPIVKDFQEWKKVLGDIADVEAMLEGDDEELAEVAAIELTALNERKKLLHGQLEMNLIPKDPFADRNTILEIRAGTGGEEASLFSGDLFRMYSRYAETKKWKVEILSSHESDKGGFKEVIFAITGSNVFSRLKFEGGTHRVQRVPVTEASGRIHTSAATVAVLPEAEEVDLEIAAEDLRIDVYRSSGPGGQSVNTTDSAVRITHIPTGLVVTCQDEKSQHKNRARAMKVLRSRLLEAEQSKQMQEQHAKRKLMVGTGDRSGRIRTYNYPQSRVTDHRINLTLHRLEEIMEGNLDELIDALIKEDQLDLLNQVS